MPGILLLSSSALTDRMMLHSAWLRKLATRTKAYVWTLSANNPEVRGLWNNLPAETSLLPKVFPYPELSVSMARRLNDFAWDFRLRCPSRLSRMRHVRDKNMSLRVRALRPAAWAIAKLGIEDRLERRVERLMCSFSRSPETVQRLFEQRPELLVTTGPFRSYEPAITGLAKRMHIPVLALITSWDNISIKDRMVFRYDGYLVWSERMKQELHEFYPHSRRVPVYITGAPQFDALLNTAHESSRQAFCRELGLDPARPIIVHALGVANGIDESHGALDLARRLERGELGDAQLIIRPHPFNNKQDLKALFRSFAPRVAVQSNPTELKERIMRSQGDRETAEWLNTFRHASVVVHLSSTVAIDAAIVGCPSVCMDYDPTPGQPNQELVREVNHLWTHYKPVAESGGTWLAQTPEELVGAIRRYLEEPGLHAAERRKMAEYVCGYLDGQCGERVADAILHFARQIGARETFRHLHEAAQV